MPLTKVLILGAGGAAGVNVCRALDRQRREYSLIAADVNAHRVLLPDADVAIVTSRADAASHLKDVQTIVAEQNADVVYAQADSEVRFLVEQADDIPAKMLLPSQGALRLAADKYGLAKHLESAGVPVPASLPYALADAMNPAALADLFHRGIGKVWIRARRGAGSKAALPVTNWQQARHWVGYWCEARSLKPVDFMACEYLPGEEFAWQGVYHNGELISSAGRKRLEYVFAEQMPSGQSSTPSLAESVHCDELNAVAEKAVGSLPGMANGVFGVDAKRNADGRICVTEINVGRFYTTSDFYAAAGVNLPHVAMQLAIGSRPSVPARNAIRPGVKWVRTLDRKPLLIDP